MDKTQIIILAGGKGTRMQSDGPKVLVPAGGEPIILRLLRAIERICPRPAIIVGYQGEKVIEMTGNRLHYIWQREQLGTGHAIACAKTELENEGFERIIVLPGDHPLLNEETVLRLVAAHKRSGAVLTLSTGLVVSFDGDFSVFYNFGRIVRGGDGQIARIVELKDATDTEKKITEVNLGYYCFQADWLWQNIDKLQNNNQAKEYYLTDLVGLAREQGKKIQAHLVDNIIEGFGVNTPEQLEVVEKYINK